MQFKSREMTFYFSEVLTYEDVSFRGGLLKQPYKRVHIIAELFEVVLHGILADKFLKEYEVYKENIRAKV